jgi:hypothetical protein
MVYGIVYYENKATSYTKFHTHQSLQNYTKFLGTPQFATFIIDRDEAYSKFHSA